MPRVIFVNGRYESPHSPKASVSFQDRGLQFGDGVYIVIAYLHGHYVDLNTHLDHLHHYCQSVHINMPVSKESMISIVKECIRRNRLREASIYIQVTRGKANRVHWFPDDALPTLIVVAKPWKYNLDHNNIDSVRVMAAQDIRWARPDVKTTSLLPTVLLRQHAKNHGAFESWLIDKNGFISEGASSNAYIVTKQGELITRPADGSIIPGVTRSKILRLASENGIKVREAAFNINDVLDAKEAFLSGATSTIKAVTHLDDNEIGNGKPGSITQKLAQLYFTYMKEGY